MKFATPFGALSGNSLQVKLPSVVWITAVGCDTVPRPAAVDVPRPAAVAVPRPAAVDVPRPVPLAVARPRPCELRPAADDDDAVRGVCDDVFPVCDDVCAVAATLTSAAASSIAVLFMACA